MQKNNDIIIDLRTIFALLLFAGAALLIARPYFAESRATPVDSVNTARVAVPPAMPSVSADGVDLVIEDVQRAGGMTLVRVIMDNHVHDLSDPAIAGRTTLDGVKAARFEPLTSGSGGHHVEGEFWFEGELAGLLTIGVTEDLTLEIDIL